MRKQMLLAVSLMACVVAGCGTPRETLPARAATEQFLISLAADGAIGAVPTENFNGKAIFVDVSNMDTYDKPYVTQKLKDSVLRGGGKLAAKPEEAQVVLQAASGALSIDRGEWFFGIPAIPLPIPTAGQTLKLPEFPLFKLIVMKGKAKLLLDAVDAKNSTLLWETPVTMGMSKQKYMWVLFTGPYGWGDVPE